MTTLKNQLHKLLNTIKEHQLPQRPVNLLAVSKTWPAENLKEAYLAGQRCFGENYLQEALIKINSLAEYDIEWHFIGPIQSNKTKDITRHFDWVHSVDRAKIAQRLSNQRPEHLAPLNICIQVNIDDEASKAGVQADDLFILAENIAQYNNLQLRGLMIIPTKTNVTDHQQHAFQRAHQLFLQLSKQYPSVDTLSMGMSSDMELAISEGSTMVRVGTALFGQRHSTQQK